MMKRFIQYCAFALCACLGSSAFAGALISDRPAWTVARTLAYVGDLYGATAVRLELTLALWRAGSESASESLKSNLRASSNHFVMATAKPMPDGDDLSPC